MILVVSGGTVTLKSTLVAPTISLHPRGLFSCSVIFGCLAISVSRKSATVVLISTLVASTISLRLCFVTSVASSGPRNVVCPKISVLSGGSVAVTIGGLNDPSRSSLLFHSCHIFFLYLALPNK